MGEFVRLEVDEASRVGTIRLDRPPVNALNDQIQEELVEAAAEAARDERVGAVVLWGGEKVFAAEDATFGQPEILLGVIPGAGGTQRLPRLVGPSKAKEMVYSGRFYGAAECEEMGLVNQVHPAAEVYQRACEAAAGYARGPGLALRAAKQVIDAGLEVDLDAGLLLERQAFGALFATEDAAEGMASFVANGPGKATFRNR